MIKTFSCRFVPRTASWCVALALIAAGCSENGITHPQRPAAPPVDVEHAIAEVTCTANIRTGAIDCANQRGADATADWIVGGQNINVRLASTNVAYDSVTEVFGADVTVQNLRLEKFGTDGIDTTGIYVFFHQAATAVAGTGSITVRNADGTGNFTGTGQDWFHYPGVIGHNATTAPKRWEWNVPRSVIQFEFKVLVSTSVLPVIVFDRNVGGNTDIYRIALDGTDLVRLTSHVAADADPSAGPGVVVFTSTRDGNQELFSISPFGGTETQLTFTSGLTHDAPAVSWDGSQIAYSRVGGSADFFRLRVMNINGGDTASISGANGAVDSNPSWKPRSDSLVFMSAGGFADGDAGLYRTSLSGTATGLVVRPGADIDPAWSPDGRYIAFSSPRAGSDDLYLLDLTTGVTTPLTNSAGAEYGPAWTSDGRIVFVSSVSGTRELRWLDPANPSVTHAIPGTTSTVRINPAVLPF